MKLRQKSKRDQALDAAASVAKTWSEWRLGEKVSKTATKASKKAAKSAAKAKAKSSKRDRRSRKPLKIAGVIALVGGVGAAIAKKLGGGKAEPLYTPPGPAPETPPSPAESSTTVPATTEPADTASTDVPPRDPSPVVVEDLLGGSDPAAPEGDESSAEPAPDPETLVSDSTEEPPGEDAVDPSDRPL